jgi:hypothetical protein
MPSLLPSKESALIFFGNSLEHGIARLPQRGFAYGARRGNLAAIARPAVWQSQQSQLETPNIPAVARV